GFEHGGVHGGAAVEAVVAHAAGQRAVAAAAADDVVSGGTIERVITRATRQQVVVVRVEGQVHGGGRAIAVLAEDGAVDVQGQRQAEGGIQGSRQGLRRMHARARLPDEHIAADRDAGRVVKRAFGPGERHAVHAAVEQVVGNAYILGVRTGL